MVAKLSGGLGPPKGLASLGDILTCKVKVVELSVPALEVCRRMRQRAAATIKYAAQSSGTDCTARNQNVEPLSDVS